MRRWVMAEGRIASIVSWGLWLLLVILMATVINLVMARISLGATIEATTAECNRASANYNRCIYRQQYTVKDPNYRRNQSERAQGKRGVVR